MTKTFLQEGDTLDLVAPATVTAGLGYIVGGFFGVAANDATSGAVAAFHVEGVFRLVANTHASNQAIAAGAAVYWDATNHRCTPDAAGNTFIGLAVVAKVSTVAYVDVKLNPAIGGAPSGALVDVVTTGATNTTPYGYATAAQADALVARVNSIIAALEAHGILTPN